jgi:hypothetical protein
MFECGLENLTIKGKLLTPEFCFGGDLSVFNSFYFF